MYHHFDRKNQLFIMRYIPSHLHEILWSKMPSGGRFSSRPLSRLQWSSPKSDPVTEGSALQAEPKSGPFSGPGGDSSNSIFKLQLGHQNFHFLLVPPHSTPSHCMTVESLLHS